MMKKKTCKLRAEKGKEEKTRSFKRKWTEKEEEALKADAMIRKGKEEGKGKGCQLNEEIVRNWQNFKEIKNKKVPKDARKRTR